jgi:small ligand-binding sensory domain FIST
MRGAARLFLAGLPVGPSRDDFLARNIIGFDARHKLLAIAAPVEQDAELMFCRRDRQAAREDLSAMLASVRTRLSGAPKGGLYIACIARGANMFGAPGVEMELIRRELGDMPLVGFLANGEIAHDQLYGYTGVLTLFV